MPKIKSRRQLKAIAEREKRAEQRAHEEAELSREARRLKSLQAGFSRSPQGGSSKSKLLKPTPFRRDTVSYPSLVSMVPTIQQERQALTPEMELREQRAQAEIKQKQKRVAVLYNKGAYQYISDEMDPATFGKK